MTYGEIYRKLCANSQDDEAERINLEKKNEAIKMVLKGNTFLRGIGNQIYYVTPDRPNEVQSIHLDTKEISLLKRFEGELIGEIKVDNPNYMIVMSETKIHIYRKGDDGELNYLYTIPDVPLITTSLVAISKTRPVISVPLHNTLQRKDDIDRIMIWSIENRSPIGYIHAKKLCCVGINNDATLIATASSLGNVVKVFETKGVIVNKFRRTLFLRAQVYSLVFSACSSFLACGSIRYERTQIHRTCEPTLVFKLHRDESKTLKSKVDQSLTRTAASARHFISSSEWSKMPAESSFASIPPSAEGHHPWVHGFIPLDGRVTLVVSDHWGKYRTARLYDVEDGGVCTSKLTIKSPHAKPNIMPRT